jgi:hypothetical protein
MAGGYTENAAAAPVRAAYTDADLISELIARVLLGNITIPVTGGTSGGLTDVEGNVANDAVDTGNPVKVGGRASSSVPTAVGSGDRVDAWYDVFGRPNMALHSAELNSSIAHTSLRDLQIAQRYTVLFDSVADGFAAFWVLSSAGSGSNPVVAVGEGTLSPGLGASGNSQMTSIPVRYFPGQSSWLNSAIRLDAGVAGNTRRWGPVTMSGTAPQDGFCFELIDTTLYATVYKSGSVVSQVASASWSRASVGTITPDTNYHSWEIRWTANSVQYYVDNVVRHVFSGTTSAITASLDFPITLQSINTSGIATPANLYIRNIGIGRFGTPPQDYTSGETRPDQAGAGAVLTFTFSIPVDFVWVTDTGTTTTNISRVDAYGGTPSATQGSVVFNQVPTPIQVPSPTNTIKVYAPTGAIISMTGQRYV